MTDLEVITEPLGGSPLSLAAQRGELPESWAPRPPVDAAEWRDHAREIAQQFGPGDWLSVLSPALEPSGEAAARLRRAADNRGVVVTSGQQPGLFGGPLYTLSKALSALALADELEARTGIPVAPVFWAATDDADFREASWTKVIIDGTVVQLSLPNARPPGTPMSATPLGDLRAELALLERASGSAAFANALEAARRAYKPEATIGGAFVALLRALLGPLGIAVLDASHPALRRQGAPVLRAALTQASAVAEALRDRTADLRVAGFEPQVVDVQDLSLVFSLRGGRKQRVPIGEAVRIAESADPATLSATVLLRPIVERAVLPTVAYAAGPAELAYFAQVSAVADVLDAARPLALPRWSGMIIEPHVARILRRLEIRYTDVRDPHALEGHLAREALPDAVSAALARIRETIERSAAALQTDPDATALVPGAAVVGAKGSLLARLQRLERRYVAAIKRRDDAIGREISTARAHLFPDGQRQERALNFIPMLARHGRPVLAAMCEAVAAHAARLVDSVGAAPVVHPRPESAHRRAGS